MIEVLNPGLITTIQDFGRSGLESMGMPASGAFDPFLAALANRLAGNDPRSPLIEFASIGPSLSFETDIVIALAAFACRYTLGGSPVTAFTSLQARKGSLLEFVSMNSWFGYIAFAGGIDVSRIYGSASTYLAGGLGSRVTKGSRLRTGSSTAKGASISTDMLLSSVTGTLWLLPGLHSELFSDEELMSFEDREYKIDPQSNRMGIRLQGEPIRAPEVKRSAPALRGTIQILPSHQPLILGPEGPVTGGYPQPCVISRTSWTDLAYSCPGSKVRLKWTEPESARKMWEDRMLRLQLS